MEYKKNFDVIKNFFENQRPIFEKGCNRIDIYKQNQSYLAGMGVDDVVGEGAVFHRRLRGGIRGIDD